MKKKLPRSKRFEILDDVYGVSVLVITGIDWKRSRAEIIKWMNWDELRLVDSKDRPQSLAQVDRR